MTIDLTDKHIGVILPEGQDRVVIGRRKLFYNVRPDNVLFSGSVELPPGNWKIFCDSKSMTEEQAQSLVLIVGTTTFDGMSYQVGWKDYTSDRQHPCKKTALESFRSLVESKGYYLDNPLGKEPEMSLEFTHYSTPKYEDNLKRWQEAQSKVIDNLIILEKQ